MAVGFLLASSSGAVCAGFSSTGCVRGQACPEPKGLGQARKVSLMFLPVSALRSGGDMGNSGCWAGQWGPGGCLTAPPSLCRRGLLGQLCGQRDGALSLIPWEPRAPAL